MIFKVLFALYKHLKVHLISVKKISNFFTGLYRVVELFGNFLKTTYQIIFPISILYFICSLSKPKCLSNISPFFFMSIYRTFEIFR